MNRIAEKRVRHGGFIRSISGTETELMNAKISSRAASLTALLCLLPAAVHAHPGHGASGFIPGVIHPVSGADHILAMVAVGIWASQLGGKALWAVPAAFVSVMSLGGALGMAHAPLPFVEQGILASVLVLGLLIVTAARVPLAAGMCIVSAFALFHGHAHGAEMPSSSAALSYALGFTLATAALHAAGICLGSALSNAARSEWVRAAGGVILAGGGAMALGLI